MKRKKIKLRYKKERVLFSDMLPYEVPIIFSNRYFYRFLVKNEIKIENDEIRWKDKISKGALSILAFILNAQTSNLQKKGSYSIKRGKFNRLNRIPFTYRILHKPNKTRELTVIHPANQILMVDFYDKYKSLMLYYTNLDRFSLRHPNKVACYFYYRDKLHHTLLGRKADNIELFFNEYENLRTFFSYKKYNNIYKFYEDYRYQRAEKKFEHLLKFDVQSCFDSIYTHSIAWATGGGRELYKENFRGSDDSFASKWDKLMQLMNYNETNGIVIGPEFSRIFAEVILQHIDARVESELRKQGYNFNKDYECYRYVDDFFFFYTNEKVKDKAMVLFANTLKEFKLNISQEKTFLFDRPFVTDITCAKQQIDMLIDEALKYHKEEILDEPKVEDELDENDNVDEEGNDDNVESEEKIREAINDKSYFHLNAKEFNIRFKSIQKECNVSSKDIINYTLARIARKLEIGLKKLDKRFKILSITLTDEKKQEFHAECKEEKSKLEKMLSRYLIAVLDVIFFLYSNNKRVNTTLKMLTILDEIIIMLENPYLIKKNTINRFSDYIRDLVFKKIQDELSLVFQVSRLDENSQIETLYFLVVLKNLRSKYHMPNAVLEKYLCLESEEGISMTSNLNAFAILILLYYFGNEHQYQNLKMALMKAVKEKFKNTPRKIRRITTELTILTLDLMTCPYIGDEDKKTIANEMGISDEDYNNMIRHFKHNPFMFTKWTGLNLTKELNAKTSQEVYS